VGASASMLALVLEPVNNTLLWCLHSRVRAAHTFAGDKWSLTVPVLYPIQQLSWKWRKFQRPIMCILIYVDLHSCVAFWVHLKTSQERDVNRGFQVPIWRQHTEEYISSILAFNQLFRRPLNALSVFWSGNDVLQMTREMPDWRRFILMKSWRSSI